MRKVKFGINYLLVIIFILLGLIGILVPILPQTIFFVLALVFLSFEFPKVEEYIEKKLGREHIVGKMYFKMHVTFKKYFG